MNINDGYLYEYIGKRLRSRRRELNMTQAEIAESAGLLRTTIANIEAGRQRVSLHILYQLCAILNLEINDILPASAEVVQPSPLVMSIEAQLQYAPPKAAALVKQLLGNKSKEENQ